MENRYLFRGKRKDNGKWVEGYLVQPVESSYIVVPYKYSTIFGDGSVIVEIDPSTICQCTGLKDKNGNLVWENDITKEFTSQGDEWCLAKIVFGEHSLNLGWCEEGIKSLDKYNQRLFNVGFGRNDANRCVVVGNIFDNPELLESKEIEEEYEKE